MKLNARRQLVQCTRVQLKSLHCAALAKLKRAGAGALEVHQEVYVSDQGAWECCLLFESIVRLLCALSERECDKQHIRLFGNACLEVCRGWMMSTCSGQPVCQALLYDHISPCVCKLTDRASQVCRPV